MKQLHIIVSGRVQGVWFRKYTKQSADTLGLKGWVRNLEGGNVEALAVGSEGALSKFLDEVRKGSPFSKVEKIEEGWSEAKETFDDFRIKR